MEKSPEASKLCYSTGHMTEIDPYYSTDPIIFLYGGALAAFADVRAIAILINATNNF